MMSERQRRFREQYVSEISPAYNGLLHVGVIAILGFGGIWYCLSQMQNATWEWLVAIPVFIAVNFGEWAMHKYIMHRRIDVFALRAIYERHTRQHHQYFTDNEATIDSVKEFRIVFFPWRVFLVIGVGGIGLGSLTALLWNANAGYVVFITMVAMYLVYEVFHYCCHVKENAFVRNMPFINTIRRHHTAHHNQGIMMHYNMNLTFPIADWFMGTSDLNRGLLGHVFNGYNTDHVREELKPIIQRFRIDDSRVTLDGPMLTDEERRVLA